MSKLLNFIIAFVLLATLVAAHQISTTATISFSPDATIPDGTIVTITGNVVCSGAQHACPSPIGGTVQIQQCMVGAVGVPAANCSGGNGVWTTIDSGSPDVSGDFSTLFDTTGLVGSIIGFRTHYVTPGGGHAPATTNSPAADLTVTAACEGVTISSDLASGNGAPAPGDSGPWTFRIKVHACEAATGVFAQGGGNGWAPMTAYAQSTGTVNVRLNKRNQVLRWLIGDMAADQEETLLVTVDGSIPPSALCDSIRYLSGPWSTTYSTDGGLTTQKSEYTGRVSVTVTC